MCVYSWTSKKTCWLCCIFLLFKLRSLIFGVLRYLHSCLLASGSFSLHLLISVHSFSSSFFKVSVSRCRSVTGVWFGLLGWCRERVCRCCWLNREVFQTQIWINIFQIFLWKSTKHKSIIRTNITVFLVSLWPHVLCNCFYSESVYTPTHMLSLTLPG